MNVLREGLAMKSKVYLTREITPEKVVELYRALGVALLVGWQ